MPTSNIGAIILRAHSEHRIECSRALEGQIVSQVEHLWNAERLDRENVLRLAKQLPQRFYSDAKLDSPEQYARVLWDSLSASPKSAATDGGTHFYAPVHAGVLQTGAQSTANVIQQINKPLDVAALLKALDDVHRAADEDNFQPQERREIQRLIGAAEAELSATNPEPSKIKRCVTALGKWTGERFTKAVDTAIEVCVRAGLGQPPSS